MMNQFKLVSVRRLDPETVNNQQQKNISLQFYGFFISKSAAVVYKLECQSVSIVLAEEMVVATLLAVKFRTN